MHSLNKLSYSLNSDGRCCQRNGFLSVLKQANVQDVTYTGRKQPRAWEGSTAETYAKLDALETETVPFTGLAHEAVAIHPKKANVAATVVSAVRGFGERRVQLITGPQASTSIHEFEVVSDIVSVTVRIKGNPSSANPHTSLQTVYILAELAKKVSRQRLFMCPEEFVMSVETYRMPENKLYLGGE